MIPFIMIICFLTRLLVVSSHILTLTAAQGVVYYVKPTEPCAHNSSSCPSNETCHTMDHYASNSSHYFSPDHINVTLYFMCGVHNCTQNLDITVGTVDAGIMPSQKQSKSVLHPDQYRQFLGSSGRVQCSNISYSLYSSNTGESLHEALSLHTSNVDVAYSFGKQRVKQLIQQYEDSHHTCIVIDLLTAPVIVNITLLAGCPLGFSYSHSRRSTVWLQLLSGPAKQPF